MNNGGSCHNCCCLSYFGFLRPDLSPREYRNKCFLVALCCLIVKRPNLEVATKRLLHQQEKIPGQSLIKKIRAASNIGQKGQFFGKKATKNFTTSYSIPFLGVLQQNKALHNFHKTGQHLIVRCIKGLDQGLFSTMFVQGLVSYELTVYHSIFNLFKLNGYGLSKVSKPDNIVQGCPKL